MPDDVTSLQLPAGRIRSRDGFDVDLSVTLDARLHDGAVDQAAFANAYAAGFPFGKAMQSHTPILKRRLLETVRQVEPVDAQDLLDHPPTEMLTKALRSELFAIGVEATNVRVVADAPQLRERQALNEMTAAARAAEGHAASLLATFEDILRKNPQVPPGRLLAALPEADQKPTLLKLHEAAFDKDHDRLLVAAGSQVLDWSQRSTATIAEVTDSLGSIRRLRVVMLDDQATVLAGTRYGLSVWPGDDPDDAVGHLPHLDDSTSASGFGAIDACSTPYEGEPADWFWLGRTGEGVSGVWCRRRSAAAPLRIRDLSLKTLGLSSVKAIAALPKGSVLAAGGRTLVRVKADDHDAVEHVDAEGDTVALLRRPSGGVLAVLADGSVKCLVLDPPEEDAIAICPTGGASFSGPVVSACVVPWLGDVRIAGLLRDGGIEVVGLDDSVRLSYACDHGELVELSAGVGRLAAVTADRQRLVIWRLDQPDRPMVDEHLIAETRTRLSDVAFL